MLECPPQPLFCALVLPVLRVFHGNNVHYVADFLDIVLVELVQQFLLVHLLFYSIVLLLHVEDFLADFATLSGIDFATGCHFISRQRVHYAGGRVIQTG